MFRPVWQKCVFVIGASEFAENSWNWKSIYDLHKTFLFCSIIGFLCGKIAFERFYSGFAIFMIPTGVIIGIGIIIPVGIPIKKRLIELDVCMYRRIQKRASSWNSRTSQVWPMQGWSWWCQKERVIGMQTARKCGNDIQEDKPYQCRLSLFLL